MINLLLYIVTCLLLFELLRNLFKEYHWLLTLVTIGLFIIHPIHTEVVNNVKSRDELLCFLFAILALKSVLTYIKKYNFLYIILAIILMAFSLLSKLSSLTFLAVIPLTIYFFGNVKGKTLLAITVSFLLLFILVKLGSNQLLESGLKELEMLFIENPLFINEGGFLSRIPMGFFTVGYYIKLLTIPYPLVFYYGYDYVPIVGWNSIVAWLSILILLPLAICTLLKIKGKQVLFFGLAYFFVTISMFSNLVRPAVGIIAERFIYIPSLGFCIVLAYLLLKLFKIPIKGKEFSVKKNFIFLGLSSILIITSGMYVFSRNKDWKIEISLTSHDIKYLKNSAKANALLGDYLLIKKHKEKDPIKQKYLANKAIYHYKQSTSIYSKNGSVYNNLGVLYTETGAYQNAIINATEAIRQGTATGNSYYNLAVAYVMSGNIESAIQNFEKSIETDSGYLESYNKLIELYFDAQRFEKALEINMRMIPIFLEQQQQIIHLGQQIAEGGFGTGTHYYIDKLREKGLINEVLYEKFIKELSLSK